MQDRTEYDVYSSTFLTDMDLTVYVVRGVQGYRVEGASLFIDCVAAKCEKAGIPSSFNQINRYFINRGGMEQASLRVDFIQGDILRLRLERGDTVGEIDRPMLLGKPKPAQTLVVEDAGDAIVASCGSLTLRVAKDSFHLTILKDGKVLYSQYNDDHHSVTADRRKKLGETDDGLTPLEVQQSYPQLEVYPFGYVENNVTGELCYTEAVRAGYKESFFGFGESFSKANKNGEKKLVWTLNTLGTSTVKSYKNIPFFLSGAGYGLYLNSARKSLFDMNSYFFKAYSVASFDAQLDLFFIAGPDYASILQGYCDLTGRCRHVPPKWSFGVWMSRNCYESRGEIEEVCRELRQRELPCDVIHLDWNYTRLETHGFDFIFDEARFPEPASMIADMREQGYRLSLWQLPYLNRGTPVYDFCKARGYFPTPPEGVDGSRDPVGVINFSNPEAVAWYQEQLRNLLHMGVAVIKTDFGENADENYIYKTIDGAQMHNLYPLLYNAAAYEVCEQVHGDEALVWGRSAYAGGQRFPLYWGGDSDSDYHGMYNDLRGGLSMGLTGFPFWSHDVGGYFGRPDPDVYIRWVQLGMLSSHVRFHGTTAREPWHYGETAVAVYRRYAALRYSLIEYLYAEAHHAVEHCVPMMRHLALDFSDDPTVLHIDDEYLLGRNILVAGVFDGEPIRRLYLPAGRWLDWHTGKIWEGGRWINYPVPLEILPIFLRVGTVTPLVEPKNYVEEQPDEFIRWKILPNGGPISGEVKAANGAIRLVASPRDSGLAISIENGEGLRHVLEIYGLSAPQKVTGGEVQSYDAKTRMLTVEAGAETVKIVL